MKAGRNAKAADKSSAPSPPTGSKALKAARPASALRRFLDVTLFEFFETLKFPSPPPLSARRVRLFAGDNRPPRPPGLGALSRRPARADAPAMTTLRRVDFPAPAARPGPALGSRPTWPDHGLRAGFYEAWGRSARALSALAQDWAGLELDHTAWDDRLWPVRGVRIGLDLPAELADAIADAPGADDVAFLALPPRSSPEEAFRRGTLDALVRLDGAGGLETLTPESEGRDAGWYDWAGLRPLTYAALFPVRFDCARVCLPADWQGERERGESVRPGTEHIALARAVIESAAVLARCPWRLSLQDRLMGRAPLSAAGSRPRPFAPYVPRRDAVQAALHRLSERMLAVETATLPTGAQRAAARVVSAFVASSLCRMRPADRRRFVEAADRIAGDEVEVTLRKAAVLLASYADQPALEAIRRADAILQKRIREGGADTMLAGLGHAGTDPSAFIQGELETSNGDPLALGRLAAGLCLICAPLSGEKIEYLREDVLDDLRFCKWAIGRDQDRALISDVFTQLARSRREPGAQASRAA